MIDDDLPDFVKKKKKSSNIHISTSISSSLPCVKCNAFFLRSSNSQSLTQCTVAQKRREPSNCFFFFLPFIFLLRRGYVHGVTFSQINLDVLEARFTCI